MSRVLVGPGAMPGAILASAMAARALPVVRPATRLQVARPAVLRAAPAPLPVQAPQAVPPAVGPVLACLCGTAPLFILRMTRFSTRTTNTKPTGGPRVKIPHSPVSGVCGTILAPVARPARHRAAPVPAAPRRPALPTVRVPVPVHRAGAGMLPTPVPGTPVSMIWM